MMRTSRLCQLAVVLALLALVGGVIAAPTPTPAEKVSRVTFMAGSVYDGAVPDFCKPITDAIAKHRPEATFAFKDKGLLVGIKEKGMAGKATVIAFKSNCMVNSQFDVQGENPVLAGVIQPTVVAWTVVHHEYLTGEVQTYNRRDGFAEVILKDVKK